MMSSLLSPMCVPSLRARTQRHTCCGEMQLLHAQRLQGPTPGRYAAPSPLANGVMPHGRGAPNRIRQIMFWNMFWNIVLF